VPTSARLHRQWVGSYITRGLPHLERISVRRALEKIERAIVDSPTARPTHSHMVVLNGA
jgi:hypothetical protein